ncbi:MAG: diaminopimelate epimerase [Desulfatiglans sp.]|nr:diaminopimelate epimerase [Desulfatiglans sp.]
MEKIEFYKMSGTGNDFILIDNRDEKVPDKEMRHIAQRACRRRDSVGADGMIYIINSDKYDFKWRFFNSDGSEAEMCGNGSRCAARFAILNGIAGEHMTFETIAGLVSADVSGRSVKVLMPTPKGLKKDINIPLEEGWEAIGFVNTGVPHVVVHVKEIKNTPVFKQGRVIRYHQMFQPSGTNANFMSLKAKDHIYVRTYERGVENETLACGTGSIASSLIANVRGLVNSPVTVTTSGGEELKVHFEKKGTDFSRVWLEGGTSIIYKGELHEEAL